MDVDDLLSLMTAEKYGNAQPSSDDSASSSDDNSASSSDDDSASMLHIFPGDNNVIWNNSVTPPSSRWLGSENKQRRRPTQASDEVWRYKSMTFLRNKFDKSCKEVDGLTEAPPQAFERWVFNCDLTPNCLPAWNPQADKVLCTELKQAGAHTKEANGIAQQMKRHAKRANHTLNSAGRNGSTKRQVVMSVVERHNNTKAKSSSSSSSSSTSASISSPVEETAAPMVRLSYGKAKVYVTREHFAKLLEMYRLNDHGTLEPTTDRRQVFSSVGKKRGRDTSDEDEDAPRPHELDAIFTVVLRYNTLVGPQTQGAGFQAALNGECFDVLLSQFGTKMECFASPLNSRYRTFCSAYSDTDSVFGSLGSFFNFHPTRGSYEANPPFVGHVMDQMVTHMLSLLEKATSNGQPLQFIVIIPCWKDDAAHQRLEKRCGPHMQRHLVVPQRDHGFTEGAQWSKADSRFRISTCDTSVFFLQSPKAAARWVITDDKLNDLTKSFRSKHRGVEASARNDGDKNSGDGEGVQSTAIAPTERQHSEPIKVDPFKSNKPKFDKSTKSKMKNTKKNKRRKR